MSSSPPTFHIRQATSPSDIIAVKTLFKAYAATLKIDLDFQDFTTELSSLPGKYAPPTGVILLAFTLPESKDEPALGVVALRPLALSNGRRTCEMKRLYCKPESRGLGVGKGLVEEVLKEAERLAYEEVRLDTLPSMEGARKLYKTWGFKEVKAYYETPIEGTIFLGRTLENAGIHVETL